MRNKIIILLFIIYVLSSLNLFAENDANKYENNVESLNNSYLVNSLIINDLVLDTLDQYYERSTDFNLYTMSDQSQNIRYLTGTNGYFHILGSKYKIFGSNIIGVLVAFGSKNIVEAPDSLDLLIATGDTNGLPTNPILANMSFSVSNIDTNSLFPEFTPLMFAAPVPVNGDIALMLQVWTQSVESDTVVIFANKQGDALGENTSFLSVIQEQGISSKNFVEFNYNMEDGKKPNFDLMILPIIENTGTSIDNLQSIQNDFFVSVSPNPVTDRLNIELGANVCGKIEIFITEITGTKLQSFKFNRSDQVSNCLELNTEKLAEGVYYLIIKNNKSAKAIKFIKN